MAIKIWYKGNGQRIEGWYSHITREKEYDDCILIAIRWNKSLRGGRDAQIFGTRDGKLKLRQNVRWNEEIK